MSDYDPAECLRAEVERFKATNTFTPMQVTNFYMQAGLVLDRLKEAEGWVEKLKDPACVRANMLRGQIGMLCEVTEYHGLQVKIDNLRDGCKTFLAYAIRIHRLQMPHSGDEKCPTCDLISQIEEALKL